MASLMSKHILPTIHLDLKKKVSQDEASPLFVVFIFWLTLKGEKVQQKPLLPSSESHQINPDGPKDSQNASNKFQ